MPAQVFGPYVQQWIDSSQDALCHRCKVLEANTFAAAVNPDLQQADGGAPSSDMRCHAELSDNML